MVSARIPKPDCAPTAPTVSVRPFNGWAEITLSEAHDDRGVTEIQLHCSTASDFTPSEGTLIAKLGPLDRRYLDHVPEGAMYHYRTLAVDTTGHVSEHLPNARQPTSPRLPTSAARFAAPTASTKGGARMCSTPPVETTPAFSTMGSGSKESMAQRSGSR